jgi:hypothetical protein
MKTIKQTDYVKVSVDVSPYDEKYTHMHMVRFETQIYDSYNKKWLDTRNFRVMMTPEEMRSLAQHLVETAGQK